MTTADTSLVYLTGIQMCLQGEEVIWGHVGLLVQALVATPATMNESEIDRRITILAQDEPKAMIGTVGIRMQIWTPLITA